MNHGPSGVRHLSVEAARTLRWTGIHAADPGTAEGICSAATPIFAIGQVRTNDRTANGIPLAAQRPGSPIPCSPQGTFGSKVENPTRAPT